MRIYDINKQQFMEVDNAYLFDIIYNMWEVWCLIHGALDGPPTTYLSSNEYRYRVEYEDELWRYWGIDTVVFQDYVKNINANVVCLNHPIFKYMVLP